MTGAPSDGGGHTRQERRQIGGEGGTRGVCRKGNKLVYDDVVSWRVCYPNLSEQLYNDLYSDSIM